MFVMNTTLFIYTLKITIFKQKTNQPNKQTNKQTKKQKQKQTENKQTNKQKTKQNKIYKKIVSKWRPNDQFSFCVNFGENWKKQKQNKTLFQRNFSMKFGS